MGRLGQQLGLAFVPGVVLADVEYLIPGVQPWMPLGHALVRVWGGDPQAIWRAIQAAPHHGFLLVLQVWPSTRWARWRAWWRVKTWPLVVWHERRRRAQR